MEASRGSANWGFHCFNATHDKELFKTKMYKGHVIEKIIHVQDTGMGITCQSSLMIRSISGKCRSTSQSGDNLLNFSNYNYQIIIGIWLIICGLSDTSILPIPGLEISTRKLAKCEWFFKVASLKNIL